MKKKSMRLMSLMLVLSLVLGVTSPVSFAAFAPVTPLDELSDEVLAYDYWDTSLSNEERAADLISHMTLEEKVLQLNSHPKANGGQDQAIPRLGVPTYGYPGENLNGIANLSLWWRAYSDEDTNGKLTATSFPTTMGQGSTWNPELIGQMGDAIGSEARVYYNVTGKGLSHWGPSVNLARDPRWGRTGDSFGEDGLLSATMASEFIKGFQGEYDTIARENGILKAIACAKHFAANNAEGTRSNGSSNMSETELREYYLRHFGYMVQDGNVESIMAAYNAINGVPCHANYELLTSILRLTWGFKGWVVADNGGVRNLNTQYGLTGGNSTKNDPENFPVLPDVASPADAIAKTLNAGLSIDLGSGVAKDLNSALSAIETGTLSEDQLDAMLLDVFTSRFATGEFDRGSTAFTGENYDSIKDWMPKNAPIAEQVATESIVMLENNGVLPIAKNDYSNVVVVSEIADEMLFSDYKSEDSDYRKENFDSTFLSALEEYFGKDKVFFYNLTMQDGKVDFEDTNSRVTFSGSLDESTLVIYIVGVKIAMMSGGSDAGEGGDRKGDGLASPRGQDEFGEYILEETNAKGADTVFMLHAQAMLDTSSWCDESGKFEGGALLWSSIMGQAQGTALANIISGKNSPSGRLTTTWYADVSQLGELQHDYTIFPSEDPAEDGNYGRTYMHFKGDITYPFGYGLSYSDFEYSNFKVKESDVTGNGTVTVSVDIKNIGSVDAHEVVQLYAVPPNADAVDVADKMLVGFQKVFVKAGETEPVEITFRPFDYLSRWHEGDKCFKLDTGSYGLYLGKNCDTPIVDCDGEVEVTADITPGLQAITLRPDSFILDPTDPEKASTDVTVSASLENDFLYPTQEDFNGSIALAFESSDSSVAKVDPVTGKITSTGKGTCVVTVTATRDGQTMEATHSIVVLSPEAVTGVTLDKETASIQVGNTVALIATVAPENATNKAITWSSSNDAVASVTDGVVTGKSAGTTIITVTTADGGKTATCTVTVTSGSGETPSGGTTTTYAITASAGTGGSISPSGKITISFGGNKTFTIKPNSGYEIDDVKVNGTSVGNVASYTFSNVRTNQTIVATFKEIKGDLKFTDVPTDAWFAKAVAFVDEQELMTGVSDSSFAPTILLDRAQVATILHRLSAASGASYKGTFSDVAAGQWYTEAIEWAATAGVVTGFSDGNFGPTTKITRQDMITMLYRFTQAMGNDVGKKSALTQFADSGELSPYALEAMQWAVEAGLITGMNSGGTLMLMPGATATRAEFAVLIMRYCTEG